MAPQQRRRFLPFCLLLTLAAPAGAQPPRPRHDAHGEPLPEGALARLGRVERFRQGGSVKALAVSPNGKLLASAGSLGLICLWDIPAGRELRTCAGHQGDVLALAISPDGKLLASSGADGTVRLWDVATGEQLRKCFGASAGVAHCLAFSRDGRYLAGVGDYHVRPLRVWHASTGVETQPSFWAHNGGRAVAFAPDGKTIVTEGEGSRCDFWDAETGKRLRTSESQKSAVLALAYSDDGRTVLSAGADGAVLDADTGKELRRFEALEGAAAAFIAPGGRWLALASGDRVRLVDAATGKPARDFRATLDGIAAVGVSADGKAVAAGGATGRLRCWDAGVPVAVAGPTDQSTIHIVAVSPDGRAAATADREGVHLWDRRSGKPLQLVGGAGDGVRCMAFSPDGALLATGHAPEGRAGWVRLWDVRSGRETRAWRAGDFAVARVQFLTDRKTLATVGEDGQLRLWDAATGKQGHALDLGAAPRSSAVAPDGKRVAVAGPQGPVYVLDVASGLKLRTLGPANGQVTDLAFAPDGRSLAAAWDGGAVRLWEIVSGGERLASPLTGAGLPAPGAGGLAFSPDGRSLVAPYQRMALRLWDTVSGRHVKELRGHRDAIRCLTLAPDGKAVVTGSLDTTALVWDVGASPPLAAPASPAEWDEAWRSLAGPDAVAAHRGIRVIAADPAAGVAWMKARLKPVPRASKPVEELIAELDHKQFQVREKAMAELLRLGQQARPALQQALAKPLALEGRRRVERLLRETDGRQVPPEDLRAVRAVEALEVIGTPEARKLLAELAGGETWALLTVEARASLARMGR